MEELYITKIVLTGTSLAVVVPRNVLAGLGWQRGDRVYFTFADDDQLIVRRMTDDIIRKLKGSGSFGDEPTIQI